MSVDVEYVCLCVWDGRKGRERRKEGEHQRAPASAVLFLVRHTIVDDD